VRAGDGPRAHDSHVGNLETSAEKALPGNELRRGEGSAYTPLTDLPADLARVVEAWSALPEHIKAAVLALIGAVGK
jgi:hypothetical protein